MLDTVPGIQQAMDTFNDDYYCCFIIPLWAHALGVLWLTQWWLKCIRACRYWWSRPCLPFHPHLSLVLFSVGHTPFQLAFFHFFAYAKLFPALGSHSHCLFFGASPPSHQDAHTFHQGLFSMSCLTFPSIPPPKRFSLITHLFYFF